MVKIYLLLLLTAHLLGDVYFQKEDTRSLSGSLLYLLPFASLLFFLPVTGSWLKICFLVSLYVALAGLNHLGLRQQLLKPALLLIMLVLFSWGFATQTLPETELLWQTFFASQTGSLVKFVCLSVWLFKPANTVFKLVFDKYQYTAQQGPADWPLLKKLPSTVEGAGAVIGNLERLMMAIFLSLNQYAAIGLILTAKSITRYNKITHDPAFSEYYLIGTLYSLLATLIPYVLIFHFV